MKNLTNHLQLTQSIDVNVPIEKMWHVFNDLSLRPKWTVDVQHIEYRNRMTTVGDVAITNCIVNGKRGSIYTKCLELVPNRKGDFMIESDTFGIAKMLHNMGFAVEFKSINNNKTKFTMLSYYQPKNFMLRLINSIIKKKMSKEVDLMLVGLKNYAETGQPNLLNPINQ